MAQVLGPLPATWETEMKLQPSGFSLVHAWLSLSLSLSLSQVDENKHS